MDIKQAGGIAFRRIRDDTLSGTAHWVERDDPRCPFRWESSRQRERDDEGEDWDEADEWSVSARRVESRGGWCAT